MSTIQIKRGLLAALTSVNPVLARGEIVWVIDENKFKVGDGTATFTALPYLKGHNLESIASANTDIAVNNTDPLNPILTLNSATSGANKIVKLNAEGKLDGSVLPALAIVDTFIVESELAQLALEVQKGDVAIRSDIGKTFINKTGNNTAMSDWAEILAPGTGVTGVTAGNGMDFTNITTTGSVTLGTPSSVTGSSINEVTATSHTHALSIDSDDVPEGTTNLYYTDARTRAAISAGDGISYNSSTGVIGTNVNATQFEYISGVLNVKALDGGEITA